MVKALHRLSHPSVPRELWIWAALTGLGASAVASAIFGIVLIPLRTTNAAVYAASAVAIVTIAIGLAVAWRAGGARAIGLYLVIHAAYWLASFPGSLVFCERSGETNCLARFAVVQWRTFAGVVLAVAVARFMRPGGAGRSPTLSATGAYVTTQQLLSVPMAVLAFSAIAAGGPDYAITQVAYFSTAAVGAAAVSGVVLGIRRAPWRGALVPIGVIALTWASQSWTLLTFEQKPPWTLITLLTGPVQLVAVIVAQAISRPKEEAATPEPH